jgi:hypothetical protein
MYSPHLLLLRPLPAQDLQVLRQNHRNATAMTSANIDQSLIVKFGPQMTPIVFIGESLRRRFIGHLRWSHLLFCRLVMIAG